MRYRAVSRGLQSVGGTMTDDDTAKQVLDLNDLQRLAQLSQQAFPLSPVPPARWCGIKHILAQNYFVQYIVLRFEETTARVKTKGTRRPEQGLPGPI